MKLHILDNGLTGKSGHNYEYTSSVYDAWVERGGEGTIYSARDVSKEVMSLYPVQPLFRRSIYDSFSPVNLPPILNGLLNLVAGNVSCFRDLKKLEVESREDVVLAHTINHGQIFALYWWFQSLSREDLPRLVLLFRRNNTVSGPRPRKLATYRIYQALFSMIERSPRKERITFTTDSEELAQEYGGMTSRPFSVLPIPHIPPPRDAEGPGNDATTFIYLGDARDEKGYPLIPEAIRHVPDDLRFIIQSNPAALPGDRTLAAREELSAIGGRVEMIDRSLDSDAFYRLMGRADAVLIPYRACEYHARTSGIFAEALALGKAVIVPECTWMERQLIEYEGGGETFSGDDALSLAQAMVRFTENKPALMARAAGAAARWSRYHNAQNYIDKLLEAIDHE